MWTLIKDLVKQQYPNRLSSPQKMWTLIVDLVKQQYPNRLSSPQKMWTLIVDLVKKNNIQIGFLLHKRCGLSL